MYQEWSVIHLPSCQHFDTSEGKKNPSNTRYSTPDPPLIIWSCRRKRSVATAWDHSAFSHVLWYITAPLRISFGHIPVRALRPDTTEVGFI